MSNLSPVVVCVSTQQVGALSIQICRACWLKCTIGRRYANKPPFPLSFYAFFPCRAMKNNGQIIGVTRFTFVLNPEREKKNHQQKIETIDRCSRREKLCLSKMAWPRLSRWTLYCYARKRIQSFIKPVIYLIIKPDNRWSVFISQIK